jgi:DNA (cytosine-5)-methyltransferase 1
LNHCQDEIVKVSGLFAGIGGIELGMAAAGHETVLFCERWAPARAVLSHRYPDVPIHGDVNTLASLPGETTVVTAGFPCQDLSQAGTTAGIDGVRSGLVAQVFRLIDAQRVPIVVLENVSFMLRLARGKAMTRLVEEFEQRRYRWAYRVVNSLAYLPQRRERVFFVASKCDIDPWDVLLADDVPVTAPDARLDSHAHGFYWTEGTRGLGWAPDAIPTLKNGSTIGIPSPPAILLPTGLVIKPDLRDAERLQGFPEDWTVAAESVAKASARWSLVGNAVTVPVATWLAGRLADPGRYDASRRDRPFAAESWPNAARGDGRGRFAVAAGKFPESAKRPPLHEFLRYPGSPLSARAARGFLSRTEAGSLRFVPGFRERVRLHAAAMEAGRLAAE